MLKCGMAEDRKVNIAPRFSDIAAAGEPERGELIRKLISNMTLDEKIAQMSGNMRKRELLRKYNLKPYYAGENKRLGIPPLCFSDGPRGVAAGRSTCFPCPMARGASWDPELEERIGHAIGIETAIAGANMSGSICVNILRHPGWGRAQETYGEDPYLLGEMGAALTRGLRGHVMPCVKHFACNSIENSRFFVDIVIDERTLREIYLPHFKKCVDAGAVSVMTAYNQVNGELCGFNTHLIRDILKNEWRFGGFTVSDWVFGVKNGLRAANAGLDLEMPCTSHYGKKLRRHVLRGAVPESAIDEAVARILGQKAAYAPPAPKYDAGNHSNPERAALAYEAACKSIVLLKNKNNVLPLRNNTSSKIAVIGRLAEIENIGDLGSSGVMPPYVVTPLEGIRNRAAGGVEVLFDNGKNLKRARLAARGADAVIVIAGLTYKEEGEYLPHLPWIGGDRTDLRLPARQEALIRAVAEENSRCIVVLESGSAIVMRGWIDRVSAVLMAWYPGMEGGNAISDIIFGNINPSGKLPAMFPKDTSKLPYFNTKDKKIEYGYFHGYRLFDRENIEPEFPFGFGLSYTTFNYADLRLDRSEITADGKVTASVDVTNTGGVAGEEAVQFYVGYPAGPVERPVKDLKGFRKVSLQPRETKTAVIQIAAAELARYDTAASAWIIDPGEYAILAGSSSAQSDLCLKATINIV